MLVLIFLNIFGQFMDWSNQIIIGVNASQSFLYSQIVSFGGSIYTSILYMGKTQLITLKIETRMRFIQWTIVCKEEKDDREIDLPVALHSNQAINYAIIQYKLTSRCTRNDSVSSVRLQCLSYHSVYPQLPLNEKISQV